MGAPLGPKYILDSYMEPLGQSYGIGAQGSGLGFWVRSRV